MNKVQGCRIRIKRCENYIQNALIGSKRCKTPHAREIMRNAYLREQGRLVMLKIELENLVNGTNKTLLDKYLIH